MKFWLFETLSISFRQISTALLTLQQETCSYIKIEAFFFFFGNRFYRGRFQVQKLQIDFFRLKLVQVPETNVFLIELDWTTTTSMRIFFHFLTTITLFFVPANNLNHLTVQFDFQLQLGHEEYYFSFQFKHIINWWIGCSFC